MAKKKEAETADTEELKNQGRMHNAERDRKIKEAEGLYIRGFSLQSISEFETIRVSLRTLAIWKKRHAWDEKKRLENTSPNEIRAMIRTNVAAIKSGKQMPYKPDDISKLAAALEKMDDVKRKAVYFIDAFDSFIDWFTGIVAKSDGKKREDSLHLLKQIRLLQENYIDTLAK